MLNLINAVTLFVTLYVPTHKMLIVGLLCMVMFTLLTANDCKPVVDGIVVACGTVVKCP